MKRIRTTMAGSMTSGPFITHDALLSTLSPAESAAEARRVAALTAVDLGLIWDGVFRRPLRPSRSASCRPAFRMH
jgi:hypothetical protein